MTDAGTTMPVRQPAAGLSAIARLFAVGRWRGVIWGVVALSCLGWWYMNGFVAPFDRALLELQYQMLPHAAGGGLTLVEIDETSLRRLDTWPWPRALFAAAIERLTEAGARTIALDVDFSAHSAPADDARLADAIARAGGRVVLPVFQQAATEPGGRLVFTAPIDAFQRNARLATVTIQPASDGRIWWAKTMDLWNGWRLPTLPGLLAGTASQRRRFPGDAFLIDYGIRPTSIARLSFANLIEGKFDSRLIAGKTVLIGATAVELGDHFTVPLHTEMPGIMIEALASESLTQGTATYPAAPAWTLAAMVLLTVPAGWLFGRLGWRAGALIAVAVAAATFAAAMALRVYRGIDLEAGTPILGIGAAYFVAIVRALDLQALHLFASQAEAAERRALMQSVVQSSADGIVITESDGTVRIVNPTAARMLGCAIDTAAGRRLQTLVGSHPGSADGDPLGMDGHVPYETVLSPPGSNPMPVEITVCRAVHSGIRVGRKPKKVGQPLYIYTIRDVTAHVAAALAERHAREEAVLNSRAKSEFLANMSHELRTPLNAIMGFSDILRAQTVAPLAPEKYRDYAHDIHEAGTRLQIMVNDVLDASRIELGKVQLAETMLEILPVVDSAVRLVAARLSDKNIELNRMLPSDLPPLWADERMLKQMVVHLLSNAAKFTATGGRVSVEARVERDGALIIAVADTGIGIAPPDLARVTQPFFQAESSHQRRFEGAGLGLAIVQGLVVLHGGTLQIDSTVGVGTRAALHFPPERVGSRLATVA